MGLGHVFNNIFLPYKVKQIVVICVYKQRIHNRREFVVFFFAIISSIQSTKLA